MSNKVLLPRPKLINTTPSIWKDKNTGQTITNTNTRPHKVVANLYFDIDKLLQSDYQNKHENILFLIGDLDSNYLKENEQKIIDAFSSIRIIILKSSTQAYLTSILPELAFFMKNKIIIDTIHEYFNFLGSAWNNTMEDALAIFSIINNFAQLLVDFDFVRNNIHEDRIKLLKNLEIKPTSESPINEFWLFTQFYLPKQKARFDEIIFTLQKNIENKFIDRIVLFLEKEEDKKSLQSLGLNNGKIDIVIQGCRLAYDDFFKYVASDKVPTNTIVALANSDIYFDGSLMTLWSIELREKCLALLRWEHSDKGTEAATLFGPRPDSQDTWMFHAESIKKRAKSVWTDKTFQNLHYYLGTPGCDNSFTTDMIREKFMVCNPAGTIRTYHVHASGIRTYTSMDTVYRPIYFGIHPTYITEKNNEKNIPGKLYSSTPYSVDIKLRSNTESRVTTYVNMLARGKRYTWSPPPQKNGFEGKWRIWKLNGGYIVNMMGLVSNTSSILIGDNDVSEFWKNLNINNYNQTLRVQKMLVVPIKNDQAISTRSAFMINYVAPLLRSLVDMMKVEDHPDVLSVWWPQQFFDMAASINFPIRLELIPCSKDVNLYADEVYMVQPGYTEVCQESIYAIRNQMQHNSVGDNFKKLIILTSEPVLTSDYADRLSMEVEKLGWSCDIYSQADPPSYKVFQTAGGVVFWGDNGLSARWHDLWALPVGAKMFEFQNEFKLDGEAQIMGAACGLDTRIFILQKAEPSYLQNLATKYIMECLHESPQE